MSVPQCKGVLVVEDDQAIRSMLVELIAEEGYSVSSAGHGLEALKQLHGSETRPCLILLDLHMPVMSGWEFRAAQQQDALIGDIPVVVVSADRSLQYGAPTLDAVEYLSKPIDFSRLLGLLERYCGG
jgi:CheY-like chemotaxis protein